MNQQPEIKAKVKKIWIDPIVHRNLKTEASKEGFSIKDFIPHLLKNYQTRKQTNHIPQ
jgi:uncharacterized protein YbaR (Trm112 family)